MPYSTFSKVYDVLLELKEGGDATVEELAERIFSNWPKAKSFTFFRRTAEDRPPIEQPCTRRCIVLPGCEKLWLPRRAKGIDPEEEKRLFYVAVTRAKDRVLITHPWSRVGTGENIDPLCRGKPFGREISPFVEKLGVPMPTMWIN